MKQIVRCYKPDGAVKDFSKILSYGDLRTRINGWLETHAIGGLVVVCDEEGKLKQLPVSRVIGGIQFVGDVYVGRFTDRGLEPVGEQTLSDFEAEYLGSMQGK